jgi:hypothetical protein
MRANPIIARPVAVRRRGVTLVEVTVAAGLLAVLLGVSGQFLRVLSSQQRAAERRVVALQAVQAVAEALGNLPAEKLTTEAARQVAIPEGLAPYLPGGQLAVAVADENDPVAAKRVSIELSWNGPHGQPAGPVRLTTWVYPDSPPAQ